MIFGTSITNRPLRFLFLLIKCSAILGWLYMFVFIILQKMINKQGGLELKITLVFWLLIGAFCITSIVIDIKFLKSSRKSNDADKHKY